MDRRFNGYPVAFQFILSPRSLNLSYLFQFSIQQTLQLDTTRYPELLDADLVSASKRSMGDLTYYDFDLAMAPRTCTEGADNLGLGFCPYEQIGTICFSGD